ncbi:MAG: tRNA 4-thiouridine(8) synthase ThiI, partial [Clostridia bacterium]|nr:tRNA 4-thiouridine(8) synthase ThiI [Clostridia bacterium]
MEKVVIIRYAEIHLKGKNRGYFERVFTVNLERSLKGIRHELHRTSGRYLVANFDAERIDEILSRVSRVFGVHSYSLGYLVPNNLDDIFSAVKIVAPKTGTFKVDTHRADKKYPLTSMEMNAEMGARILGDNNALKVDVHEPQSHVYIDVRENGTALVFGKFLEGAGGMPVGTSGKGLLLISGGIDSPVAGYMMSKRGMNVEYLHFHSYPYTNEQAKDKVVELARLLSRYALTEKLSTVSVTHIQEEIHAKCAAELNVTLLRRFMFRIAERVAKKKDAKCLITGESLGQVASQTIEGMTSSNAVVSLPVLRPLVGFDKNEIIERSKKIGTYDTSVLPFEDCCTVFLPDFPAIKPKLSFIEEEESKLDIEGLVNEALATLEE